MEGRQKHLCGLERDRWRKCRNLDARSTGVEALNTPIHSLFGYDPAIVPMIIPDQMPRLLAPVGFIYLQRGKAALAEGGPPSLARL